MGDPASTQSQSPAWNREKDAFEMLCTTADLYGDLPGVSKTDSDIWLFKTVEGIATRAGQFKPNGWAIKFYEHFLYGNGRDVRFDLAVLLVEDQGVRSRVSTEISNAIRQKPELGRKRWVTGGFCSQLRRRKELYDKNYHSPFEFSLVQVYKNTHKSDYAVKDWKNALGSFFIEWEAISSSAILSEARGPICGYKFGEDWIDDGTNVRARMRSTGTFGKSWFENGMPKYANVWGLREYHWHPKAEVSDRADACLHEAGYRLRSRNYWIFANPCVIEIASGMPVGI